MPKISKTLILASILLSAGVIIYIFFSNNSSKSFKEAHQDAQQRVQHIQTEIEHAQHVIRETKDQLDSMEEHVNTLQAEQTRITRAHHSNNLEITYRLALERENLNQLKLEYDSIQQEKKELEAKLDSLSASIQHNF